jgi:hypothetical protein
MRCSNHKHAVGHKTEIIFKCLSFESAIVSIKSPRLMTGHSTITLFSTLNTVGIEKDNGGVVSEHQGAMSIEIALDVLPNAVLDFATYVLFSYVTPEHCPL